jgi:hypothetical protein
VDRYVGDTADIAQAAKTFRGFLGDSAAHRFRPTSDIRPVLHLR